MTDCCRCAPSDCTPIALRLHSEQRVTSARILAQVRASQAVNASNRHGQIIRISMLPPSSSSSSSSSKNRPANARPAGDSTKSCCHGRPLISCGPFLMALTVTGPRRQCHRSRRQPLQAGPLPRLSVPPPTTFSTRSNTIRQSNPTFHPPLHDQRNPKQIFRRPTGKCSRMHSNPCSAPSPPTMRMRTCASA